MPARTYELALVTGASAGIGSCYAERLAKDGSDLILVARRRERLESLAQKLRGQYGVECEVLAADLADPGELRKVEKRIAGESRLDLLVNNAGFGTVGAFREMTADRAEGEVRLNVLALVRLTHAALPGFIERGCGAIVNVSSNAGFQPNPFFANYGATKAFVNSFSEALAGELEGSGVQVQVVCPGPVHTEFTEVAGGDEDRVPGALWVQPEAVVEASLAGLANGQLVCVPGALMRMMSVLQGAMPRSLARRVSLRMGRAYFA